MFDLDELDDEVDRARQQAARAVDRVQALVELRSHALAVYDELRRPIYFADLFQPQDEETRAYVNALVNRITEED